MNTTTLKNLPILFKENSNMKIAYWIIKYQKFSMKAAIKNAPDGYSISTLNNYMTYGLQYINKGRRIKMYEWLYPHLDKALKQHLQPLTPSAAEERKKFKDYTAKDSTPPIAKLACVTKPITSKFEYGIRFGNRIELFNSEDEAKGFNRGLEYAGEAAGKLISVEIGEV